MPRRRQIDSLKQLCVHVIIKNITKYATSELHSIPTNILEDMIRFPKDDDDLFASTEKSLRISDVDKIRLIRQNITRLCLKFDFKLNLQGPQGRYLYSDLLNAVLKTSNSLTHFICNTTRTWTHQDFLTFTVNIPNVVVLKITKENSVNDDIFEALGDHCPKLESLTLKCSKITDEGIRRFCLSKSKGSKLKYLKFGQDCRVTPDGCIIALQNLKQLKVFDYEIIKAFKKLFQDLNEGEHPTFQLCEISQMWHMEDLTNGVLNFITKCCPDLNSLSVEMDRRFEKDIAKLKECGLHLDMSIDGMSDSDFEPQMTTIKQWGEVGNITSLMINDAEVILDIIGFACPNLKDFNLSCVTHLPLNDPEIRRNQKPFSKLQKLVIEDFAHSTISIPQLKFLLKHCLELEEISLFSCTEINDDVMISVLREINPLKSLTSFSIDCPVSIVSIMELLKMENNLRHLTLSDFLNSIPVGERNIIKSYLKENNYLVNFVYKKDYDE